LSGSDYRDQALFPDWCEFYGFVFSYCAKQQGCQSKKSINQWLKFWHDVCGIPVELSTGDTIMQCYEFETVLKYMTQKVKEMGVSRRYDQLELADILFDHDVTTLDRLGDVVSLARNLQCGIRLAA